MEWSDSTTHFFDSSAARGNNEYIIVSIDRSGNKTESQVLRTYYGGRNNKPDILASVDRKNKRILLTWSETQNVYSVNVYPALGDGQYVFLGSGEKDYSDRNLSINNTYRYKIKMVYKNGHQSGFSDVVEVVY